MSDRENVSISSSERVAARDYVEVHDYHETHKTNIAAPGSTIFVTPANGTNDQFAAVGPELGACKKCHRLLWIRAVECHHCGYDSRIEAADREKEAETLMAVLFLGWIVAAALLYQVAEMVGIPATARMGFSMIGGAVTVLGVLIFRMWPRR